MAFIVSFSEATWAVPGNGQVLRADATSPWDHQSGASEASSQDLGLLADAERASSSISARTWFRYLRRSLSRGVFSR